MKLRLIDARSNQCVNEFEFSIRHFRQEEGKQYSSNGGYTVMAMNGPERPYIVVSKCSKKDHFSRKLGVLNCIAKFIEREELVLDWMKLEPCSQYPLGDAVLIGIDNFGKNFNVFVV